MGGQVGLASMQPVGAPVPSGRKPMARLIGGKRWPSLGGKPFTPGCHARRRKIDEIVMTEGLPRKEKIRQHKPFDTAGGSPYIEGSLRLGSLQKCSGSARGPAVRGH